MAELMKCCENIGTWIGSPRTHMNYLDAVEYTYNPDIGEAEKGSLNFAGQPV